MALRVPMLLNPGGFSYDGLLNPGGFSYQGLAKEILHQSESSRPKWGYIPRRPAADCRQLVAQRGGVA